MLRYEYVTVNVKVGFLSSKMTDYREVIAEYASKGFRYVGWFPKKSSNMLSGVLEEIDLIFEKDE